MAMITLKCILCNVTRLKWEDIKRLTQDVRCGKWRRLRQKPVSPIIQKRAIKCRRKWILLSARNHERAPLFVAHLKHVEGTKLMHLLQTLDFGRRECTGQSSKEHPYRDSASNGLDKGLDATEPFPNIGLEELGFWCSRFLCF